MLKLKKKASRPTKKIKLIRGGHFKFQQNLEKVTRTSAYHGECDSKI